MSRRSALLLAVIGLLFILNTWAYDLWAPDEPFFGDGARAMLDEGRWLVPHVNGKVNEHKPPLFFWLIALVSAATGGTVSAFAARLPSVLAATATVALTMRLGRRMGGQAAWTSGQAAGGTSGEAAGMWAGAILATSYLFWDKARSAQIEALLSLCIVSALSAFAEWRSRRSAAHAAGDLGAAVDGRRAGLVFWVACAAGTLAKGPVGLLLPLGIALLTLALDRDLRAWRGFAPVLGPLACLAVIGLWAVPAELFGGSYSVIGAVKTHFFSRALQGMHHKNPPWYYLLTIPLHMLPWSFLLPGALLAAWRNRSDATERFLLAWVLFVVLFFSLSGERRDLYVLPAFPALALLVARFTARASGSRAITLPQGILGALLLAVGAVAPVLLGRQLERLPVAAGWIVSLTLAAAGAAILLGAARGRVTASLAATGGGMAAAYAVVTLFVFPALDAGKSARGFAERMAAETAAYRAAGGTVMAYRMGNVPNALSYFTGIHTLEEDDPARLEAHLATQPAPRFAVADAAAIENLPADLRARVDVLTRAPLSRTDAVLVTTR